MGQSKRTLASFIEKSNIIHNSKYNYDDVIYTYNNIPVIIKCPNHGVFKQRPHSHLGGAGCPSCGRINSNIKRRNTTNFKSKFTKLFPSYKLISEYNGLSNSVIVEDCDGFRFKVKASHLLEGNTPSIASSLNKNLYFQHRLNKISSNLILCSDYINSYTPVVVKDELDIKYSISPDELLLGVKNHIKNSLNKTEYFCKKSSIIHSEKYIYTKTKYINSHDKVIIICPEHGEFLQVSSDHLKGSGCPDCRKNNSIWTYSCWEESGKKSTQFDNFKLYIIRFYNSSESFYKIGKTYLTLSRRFGRCPNKHHPYNIDIVYYYISSSRSISKLEHKLHAYYKQYRYTPKMPFNGDTECFSDISIEFIKGLCL